MTNGAPRHHQVVVVGGGQAGLSVSWHLRAAGIDHVVLERNRVAHAWREQRWDSFCLVTPNWQCQLPGFPYDGPDPDGFMVKDEIVEYVESFAKSFDPPLREGVEVTRIARDRGRYDVETSDGPITADHVVIASGGYQVPIVPRFAERLPVEMMQIDASQYRNPEQLPSGEVLVVGSGQSGAQIAEDLHLAGRRVHLCVGDAPRVARFYRGRDVVAWLQDMGYYRLTIDERPSTEGARARANHYVTGRDGGRDIDLREFALQGMALYGLLTGLQDGTLTFNPDLSAALDAADAVSESIKTSIDTYIAEQGIDAPVEARYVPRWRPEADPTALPLAGSGITSVIWAIGYRADYSWVYRPVFDGRGLPMHHRGVTADPGLYFIGLPWQWTWGSARFSGVGADAAHLADVIGGRSSTNRPRLAERINRLVLGS